MANTPCARDALIHGIAGGLVVGVLYFMKSSKEPSLKVWAELHIPDS